MGAFMFLAWRFRSVEDELADQKNEEIVPITATTGSIATTTVADDDKKTKGLDNVAFTKDE